MKSIEAHYKTTGGVQTSQIFGVQNIFIDFDFYRGNNCVI